MVAVFTASHNLKTYVNLRVYKLNHNICIVRRASVRFQPKPPESISMF